MSYDLLDKIADKCNPVMMVALIGLSIYWLKAAALPFLLRNGLAVILVQQISKLVQKHGPWGHNFPSTHFAVALALAVGLVVLKRRLWPVALAFVLGYGSLMLYAHFTYGEYHTPIELLAALYAVPLTLLFHWKPRRKPTEAATVLNN